jgi:hypothetical protein
MKTKSRITTPKKMMIGTQWYQSNLTFSPYRVLNKKLNSLGGPFKSFLMFPNFHHFENVVGIYDFSFGDLK